MICHKCKGIGEIFGFCVSIPCNICLGSGELPENIRYDPGRGQELKQARMAGDLTLREYCKEFGLNAVEMAEQEGGFFRL